MHILRVRLEAQLPSQTLLDAACGKQLVRLPCYDADVPTSCHCDLGSSRWYKMQLGYAKTWPAFWLIHMAFATSVHEAKPNLYQKNPVQQAALQEPVTATANPFSAENYSRTSSWPVWSASAIRKHLADCHGVTRRCGHAQAGSVMGSSAGGAHAAVKQQKAHLASLIARLRTQRQACQVSCPPPPSHTITRAKSSHLCTLL